MKLFIASRASVVIGAALMLWITLPPGAHGTVKEQGGGTDPSYTCKICGHDGIVMHEYGLETEFYSVAGMCFHGTSDDPSLHGYICLSDAYPKSNDLIQDTYYKALGNFTCNNDTVPLKVDNASWYGSNLTMKICIENESYDGELMCTGYTGDGSTATCRGAIVAESERYYFRDLMVSNTCLTSII